MKKHAYLIMAHNDFAILERLIKLLDDHRNDIYLHIDKKVKDFNFEFYQKLPTKSKLFFVERLDIRWGDFSQIQCELKMLKAAIDGKYQYYHLLSGVDLPLKSNDEIHSFFDEHQGKEFVHFCSPEAAKSVEDRVLYHHFMRVPAKIRKCIDFAIQKTAKIVRYKRQWDDSVAIQFGANWFSITHALAEYVISKENWINQYFHHSSCADEIFLQTITYNSEFFDHLYRKNMDSNYSACVRYIDWKRGNPYVFREADWELLMNSGELFARKFSTNVDERIVQQIYAHISAANQKEKTLE